jgi:two-component system sensor histidine kinase DegS
MVLPLPQTKEFVDRLIALADECRSDLGEASQSLQEIGLLVGQSTTEVDRLTQREMSLANRVREMEANLESFARKDIRDMYHAAHEVELRLMMMRSQVEQLEEREKSIRSYQEKLRILLELSESQIKAEEQKAAQPDNRTRLLRRSQTSSVTIPYEEVVQAEEDERLRVARQVLDGPAQTLANVLLRTEICQQTMQRDPAQAQDELSDLRGVASNALRDTRRLLYELRPVVLKEIGVVPTLRRYVAEIVRLRGIEANIVGPETDEKLPEVLRVALYRLVLQMISAVASEELVTGVDIDVRYEDAQVIGRVEARGEGLERSQRIQRFLTDESVRRRIERLSADLQSESAGSQTYRLTVVIPLG